MSGLHIFIAGLLVVAVASGVLAVVGVGVMRSAHDRLHYLAPVSVIGSAVVAIAVVSAEAFDARGIKAIIVFVVLAGLNPVLVHAIARAARSRASDVPR